MTPRWNLAKTYAMTTKPGSLSGSTRVLPSLLLAYVKTAPPFGYDFSGATGIRVPDQPGRVPVRQWRVPSYSP